MKRALASRWSPLWFGALSLLVSAPFLGTPSKWSDEGATISAAHRSFGDLWRLVQDLDAVHLAYYAFMHVWVGVFGDSALAIRVPSLIAIALAAVGVAELGRRLGGAPLMLAAGLVFVVLPRVTWLAIEARSFPFTVTIVVWATVVLLHLFGGHSRRWWIAYAGLMGLGIALNLYVGLALLAHGIWVLVAMRKVVVGLVVAAVASVVLASPVVVLALGQRDQLAFGPFTLAHVWNLFGIEQFFLGVPPVRDKFLGVPPTEPWQVGALLLAVLGWGLIVVGAVTTRRVAAFALPMIFAPALVLFGYSALVATIYTPRYLSFTTPAAALLIGAGIVALPRVWLRVLAIVLIAAFAAPIYVAQRTPTGKGGVDWSSAAAIVGANKQPGDSIYWALRYGRKYTPIASVGPSTARIGETFSDDFDGLASVTRTGSPAATATLWGSERTLSKSAAKVDAATRLWVVTDHYGVPDFHQVRGEEFLLRHGLRLEQAWEGVGTDVYLWVRD